MPLLLRLPCHVSPQTLSLDSFIPQGPFVWYLGTVMRNTTKISVAQDLQFQIPCLHESQAGILPSFEMFMGQ